MNKIIINGHIFERNSENMYKFAYMMLTNAIKNNNEEDIMKIMNILTHMDKTEPITSRKYVDKILYKMKWNMLIVKEIYNSNDETIKDTLYRLWFAKQIELLPEIRQRIANYLFI